MMRSAQAAALAAIDQQFALAALIGFASRLKARRVTRLEAERVRWREDGAHVELVDGAVLVVTVHERDKQRPPTVELEHLHRLGEVVKTGAVAEAWLEAHERELVDSWAEHCRSER
jgi:hypothetical protein